MSQNLDPPADGDSDSEDEDASGCATGLMDLLKQFKPTMHPEAKTSAPKASAKRTAARSTNSSASKAAKLSAASTSANTAPATLKPSQKRAIGGAGGGSGGQSKKAKKMADPAMTSIEELGLSDEMCQADKETCEGYWGKLKTLRKLDPPLSEPAFKSRLGDIMTETLAFIHEVKTKKRSASRRQKESDPLIPELEKIEESINDHLHIVKCSWL